jgi:hypothetical protein
LYLASERVGHWYRAHNGIPPAFASDNEIVWNFQSAFGYYGENVGTDAQELARRSAEFLAVEEEIVDALESAAALQKGSRPFTAVRGSGGTERVFRQEFTLENAIGSHACSLEALTCV